MNKRVKNVNQFLFVNKKENRVKEVHIKVFGNSKEIKKAKLPKFHGYKTRNATNFTDIENM